MSRGIAIYLREKKDVIYEIISCVVEWSRTQINIYNNINSVLFQRHLQQDYPETELSATTLFVEIMTTHTDTDEGNSWFDVSSRELRETYTSRELEMVQLILQTVGYSDELLSMDGYNDTDIIPVLKKCDPSVDMACATECPICYAEFPKMDMIETECLHSFCGPCLYQCYDKMTYDKGMSCPMCRHSIAKLYAYSQERVTDMKNKFCETSIEVAIRGLLSLSEIDDERDDDSIS